MFKFEKVHTINYKKDKMVEKDKFGLFYYTKSGRIYTIFMI